MFWGNKKLFSSSHPALNVGLMKTKVILQVIYKSDDAPFHFVWFVSLSNVQGDLFITSCSEKSLNFRKLERKNRFEAKHSAV